MHPQKTSYVTFTELNFMCTDIVHTGAAITLSQCTTTLTLQCLHTCSKLDLIWSLDSFYFASSTYAEITFFSLDSSSFPQWPSERNPTDPKCVKPTKKKARTYLQLDVGKNCFQNSLWKLKMWAYQSSADAFSSLQSCRNACYTHRSMRSIVFIHKLWFRQRMHEAWNGSCH